MYSPPRLTSSLKPEPYSSAGLSFSQSFSLSIHSRTYAGQFSSFMPSASQLLRNLTASRSASLTSRKSRMMFRSRSKSSFSSGTCAASIRPLRVNTVNLCRVDLSILKVIGYRRDAVHCRHSRPATQVEMQYGGHMQHIENRRLEVTVG